MSAARPRDRSASPPAPGAPNRVRQAPNRALYEREALDAVLDAANVGHVAFVHADRPVGIPTAVARLDDALYLHGLRSARMYETLAGGAPACVSVCLVDGLVKARSAFHCSMNYRSAVVHGTCTAVEGEDLVPTLDRMTERLIPGSAGDFREHLAKELRATLLLALPLETWAVKVRDDGPVDDDEDLELPHWAGVVPIVSRRLAPVPARNLPAGVAAPAGLGGATADA